jgi:putative phosphoribosyl transferase
VPVAFAVADRLLLPLDVVVARKLGVPWQPELAMGAIAGSTQVLDKRAIGKLAITEQELNEVLERERAEMTRREELYRAGAPLLDLHGQTAILVDDGLATGSTMAAAVRHVRSLGTARVIVAVPVGSREAVTGCAMKRMTSFAWQRRSSFSQLASGIGISNRSPMMKCEV